MILLKKQKNIDVQISSKKAFISSLSEFTSCSKLIDDAIKSYNKVIQGLTLYRRNQTTQTNIQNYSDDSSCILATIGSLNSELEEHQNAMKEYVLSNKICPCCGQKITDKNVSSIINNFSKEV